MHQHKSEIISKMCENTVRPVESDKRISKCVKHMRQIVKQIRKQNRKNNWKNDVPDSIRLIEMGPKSGKNLKKNTSKTSKNRCRKSPEKYAKMDQKWS